jgi:4-hydroxyphenylpyruvate dioxygenase
MSDKISATGFHHVEFYCGDATNTYKRFLLGLGMELVAKSDQSSGNVAFASYALQSGDMKMIFTAPYSAVASKNVTNVAAAKSPAALPLPGFDHKIATDFFVRHGFGVRAIAVEVADVGSSYDAMVASGGRGHTTPMRIVDDSGRGWVDFAEVFVYGDVVLRMINTRNFKGKFLPNFSDVHTTEEKPYGYGLYRFDHIVGNLWSLQPTMDLMMKMTVRGLTLALPFA